MRGKGSGGCGVSANEYSCAHGAQINFGDLTPYITYDLGCTLKCEIYFTLNYCFTFLALSSEYEKITSGKFHQL
jgi:hypothetical protein